MGDKVLQVFEEMKSILKIDRTHRDNEKIRIQLVQRKTEDTMKFWPQNILDRILRKIKQFLISMMTDRKASMSALDTKLKKRKKIFQKEKLKKTDLERNTCDK